MLACFFFRLFLQPNRNLAILDWIWAVLCSCCWSSWIRLSGIFLFVYLVLNLFYCSTKAKRTKLYPQFFLPFFFFFFFFFSFFPSLEQIFSSSKMKRLKRPHNQNTPELPRDMIRELLSWLPADSLLKFKRVCRDWRSLIEDPNFIKEHATRASPVFLWHCDLHIHKNFSTIATHPAYNVPGRRRGFSILGVFQGLIVEEIFKDGSFKLLCRNPATCKGLNLPQPHGHLNPKKYLYYDSSTDVAKLISSFLVLNRDGSVSRTGFQILQIEQGRNWRIFRMLRKDETLIKSSDNGMMYFVSHHFKIIRRCRYFHITSFNVRTESLVNHRVLLGNWSVFSNICLFLWNNCFAIGSVNEKGLHYSVHEGDDKKFKWSEITVVPLAFLRRNVNYPIVNELVPVKAINNDLWLCYRGEESIRYDMRTGEIKEKGSARVALENAVTRFKYGPSLKFLEGMQNIEIVRVEEPHPQYYINF